MRSAPPDGVWRVLADDGEREPSRNLARDEALGRGDGSHPTLKLWRNDRCVVLGRFQVAAAEVDTDACRELGVPVYRRFTGGGAVYHDPGNLNVTVVVRRDDPHVPGRLGLGQLPGLYRLVLDPLANAARALGAPVVATERDLLAGGSKIGGVAAWIGGDTLLVHGTLLVDTDLATLGRVLDGPGAPGDPRWERTRSRRARVTSLAREAAATETQSPDPSVVDAAVVAAFTKGSARYEVATPEEEALTVRLLEERYRRSGWHEIGTS